MSEDQPEGERPLLIPPAWFAIFAALAIVAGRSVPQFGYASAVGKALGVALAVAGLGFAVIALGLFRRAGTTYHPTVPGEATALVTGGVYRLTRNPMYVGMALILAGIAAWYGSVIAALLVPVFVGILTAVQIIPEERALERLFGDEYRVYKHRVPRWLVL